MLTPESVEDGKQKLQFGQPRDGGYRNDSYFNDTYETSNPNTNYLSEYGIEEVTDPDSFKKYTNDL